MKNKEILIVVSDNNAIQAYPKKTLNQALDQIAHYNFLSLIDLETKKVVSKLNSKILLELKENFNCVNFFFIFNPKITIQAHSFFGIFKKMLLKQYSSSAPNWFYLNCLFSNSDFFEFYIDLPTPKGGCLFELKQEEFLFIPNAIHIKSSDEIDYCCDDPIKTKKQQILLNKQLDWQLNNNIASFLDNRIELTIGSLPLKVKKKDYFVFESSHKNIPYSVAISKCVGKEWEFIDSFKETFDHILHNADFIFFNKKQLRLFLIKTIKDNFLKRKNKTLFI